jgi:hypothetical protein
MPPISTATIPRAAVLAPRMAELSVILVIIGNKSRLSVELFRLHSTMRVIRHRPFRWPTLGLSGAAYDRTVCTGRLSQNRSIARQHSGVDRAAYRTSRAPAEIPHFNDAPRNSLSACGSTLVHPGVPARLSVFIERRCCYLVNKTVSPLSILA